MGMPGIVIQIGADTKDAIDGIGRVNKALGDESGMTKFKAGIQGAMLPAAAALGALGAAAWDFSKAAMEDQSAASKLATALKNNTGATKADVAAMEDWIDKTSRATGIADDQLRPAMARLTNSTKDIKKAQELATLATEIATAKNLDAETVANALAKANDGQFAALKKLGISQGEQTENANLLAQAQRALGKEQDKAAQILEANGPKSKEYAKALEKVAEKTKIVEDISKSGTDWVTELGNTFKGSVAADAETAAGKMKRMQLSIEETKESIGAALLPVLEKFLPYLQAMGTWAQDNSGVLVALAGAVGVVAGAIVAINVALKLYAMYQAAAAAVTALMTTSTWAFTAALLANPITIVIAAIVALIAIFVVAYHKVDWFRKLVDTAWAAIQTAIGSVVNWLRDTAWPILQTVFEWIGSAVTLYLLPWKLAFEGIKTVVGLLASAFSTAFDAIKTALQTAWDFMQPIFDKIKGAIDAVKSGMDFVGGIGGAIGGIFGRSAPMPAALGAIDPRSRSYVSSGGVQRTSGPNIVINGAIDPVSTAKQIKRILGTGNMRLGVA